MIFRGNLNDDDWAFGRGKQNYLTLNDAIMRNVYTRLRYFYSECFFDAAKGVAWFDILGQPVRNQSFAVLAIKNEIGDCYGIIAVTDVKYVLDAMRNMTINYVVDTIYSTGVTGTVKL